MNKTFKIIIAIVAILLIGWVVYSTNQKTDNNPVTTSEWKTYKDDINGFEFSYPNSFIFKPNEVKAGFSLSHSVAFTHPDPCNLRDGGSIDKLTDFSLNGDVINGKVENVLKTANYYGVTFDSAGKPVIDSNTSLETVKIADRIGYKIGMGAEGCGVDTYYIQLKDNKTLVLKNGYVGEFASVNGYEEGGYNKLQGIILQKEGQKILEKVLSSFKFTDNNPVASDWKTYTDDFGLAFKYPASWQVSKTNNTISIVTNDVDLHTVMIVEVSGPVADDSTGKWGDYKIHFDSVKNQWIVTQSSDRSDAPYDSVITPILATKAGALIFNGAIHSHGWGQYDYVIALNTTKYLIVRGGDDDVKPQDPPTVGKLFNFVKSITN